MTRLSIDRLEAILLIGIGGFAGSNLRYGIELFVPPTLLATAIVNVLGCLALGFFFYEHQFSGAVSGPARTIITTGFISSFTTYSTFVVDALLAAPAVGLAYVAGSYALGFLGVLLGRAIARVVTSGGAS